MSDDVLAQCRWPALGPTHDRALKSAVAWALGVTEPLGIVATGTIVRGEGHASSDIDLYVLHEAPYRRRVQRFFEGVPTEIFINSPDAVRSYFESEHTTGRRITAHMLATGFIILGQESEMERICDEARSWLDLPEVLEGEKADAARYAAATPLEDAADIIDSDEVNASLLLHRAVTQMLECRLRLEGRPVPRAKSLVADVTRLDPELGRLVRQFTSAGTAAERLDVAHQIGDRTIGVHGFFEWDSGPDPAPPKFVSGKWPVDSPEAAIASYLAATYDERWDDAVDLIATEAGEQFARQDGHPLRAGGAEGCLPGRQRAGRALSTFRSATRCPVAAHFLAMACGSPGLVAPANAGAPCRLLWRSRPAAGPATRGLLWPRTPPGYI